MMRTFVILFSLLILSGCGYNALQSQDEDVKAAWSEVLNQYKRRADLVPNLVQVVQGYAQHEKEVFTQVTEARSKVGSLQLTPEILNNPENFAKFQTAQRNLTSALSRLIAVSERYPNLKADANFRALQTQLEGTENRIAVARGRYIQKVQAYNVTVRSFPTNLTAKIFSLPLRPNFSVEDEKAISEAPKINFMTNSTAPQNIPAHP